MTLEFQPPYQLQNPQVRADRQAGEFNSNLLNVGNMFLQNRQQNTQNKMQQAYLDLAKQKQAREEQDSGPLYNGMDATPQGTTSWNPSPLDIGRQPWAQSPSAPSYGGGTPSGAPSPSASPMGPQPQAPQGPQYASAGTPDTGMSAPTPQQFPQGQPTAQPMHQPGTDLTSHFQAWNAQGQPPTYNHPEMGSIGQADPMASMNWDQFRRMDKRGREGYSMFNKDQNANKLQQSEIAKNEAMAKMYGQGGPGGNKGTWHQNPMTGEMQWYPTVLPPSGQPMPPSGSGNTPPSNGMPQLPYKDRVKLEMEKPKAQGALQNTLREYDNMINEANAIKSDPSLGTATGMTSFMGSVPGTGAKNVAARLETLKAKTLLNVLSSLKNLSANGSSGFGQLSQSEGDAIRNSISSFDRHLGTPDFKASLDRFTSEMQQRKQVLQDTFDKTYGSGQSRQSDGGGNQSGGMIRVRNKQTGQSGQLPAGNFDATKYDQLQ